MNVYAESSAVTAWLLRQQRGAASSAVLEAADRVVTSTLTRLECARALGRRAGEAGVDAAVLRAAERFLDETVAGWALLALNDELLARAARRFPVEPVRTLDALHLATALEFHAALGSLTMLSLDERIRANAAALGLTVAP